MIWFQDYSLKDVSRIGKSTLSEHLGIEMLSIDQDSIVGRMPVDHRTRQPAGLLHGGASVALAETLGSVAAYCTLDLSRQTAVGIEINANHLRSVKSGWVIGTVRPVKLGRSIQVWEIKIHNEQEELVCVSRLTASILETPTQFVVSPFPK